MNPSQVYLAHLIESNLRLVPDYPQTGVLFRDITPLVANGEAFRTLIQAISAKYRGQIDLVAGLESRGFILAAPIAAELGIGMLMVRKAGKLPGPVVGADYGLEYGTARMEIRPDTVPAGARVLIVDDVLATGGTARAAAQLIEECGGQVAGLFMLMELVDLKGREQLTDLAGVELDVILQVHEN